MKEETKKIKFNDVYQLLEEDKLNPYNFYNIDLSSDQVFSISHYLENEDFDNIDTVQLLKKVFIDIEVFQNHKIGKSISEMVLKGEDLVNAISQYYSSENKFYVYLVPPKGCSLTAAEFEKYLNEESSKPVKVGVNDDGTDKMATYFEEDQKCIVKLFDNDKDLIIDMWEKIKKDDPAVLSGWNSDGFDYPLLYARLLTLLGDHNEVAKVMSKFGEVEINRSDKDRAGNTVCRVKFPEYNVVDLLYSYKDRADYFKSGNNMVNFDKWTLSQVKTKI